MSYLPPPSPIKLSPCKSASHINGSVVPMTDRGYPQIYMLKLICAFFVITIHVPSLLVPRIAIEGVSRLAVPLFFIITGFFISSNGHILSQERCRKMFIKAILFTIFSQGLYLALNVFRDYMNHGNITYITDLSFWRNLLLIGVSVNIPFWYLNALTQTIFVFWVISIFKRERLIPAFIVVGLLLNLLLGQYSWIYGKDFVSFVHRNFVTIGIPCVGLGYLIKRYETQLPQKNKMIRIMCVVIGLLIAEILINFIGGKLNFGDVYLFTIPLSCAIFCLILKIKENPSCLSNLGKKYSGLIFVLHMLVHESVSNYIPMYYIWGPFIVFAISLILAKLMKIMQQNIELIKWRISLSL